MIMPTFLVIGAARAGTSYLNYLLRQHPEIYMSSIKEPNFFAYDKFDPGARLWRVDKKLNEFPVRTLTEYAALFEGVTNEVAVGDSSPLYLESLYAPERIKQKIPDAKLVVSLRNPADRAYSDCIMHVTWGHRRIWKRKVMRIQEHEFRVSCYYQLLKRYYKLFDANQIKIILFEKWTAAPRKILPQLFEFLGVDPHFPIEVQRKKNERKFPRSLLIHYAFIKIYRAAYGKLPWRINEGLDLMLKMNLGKSPPFPPDLRNKLIETFKPDIAQLEHLIGEDLSLWLK